ncbi:hypothetical protein K491DRAFT_722153 [Lophiostoma macrostomum CBS 122681]|uniref:Uncharacterized protein n=1 Tax=Lophiostoma macrostomum CBS 122681 TaxID=1314788 RepID=A0A6A6SPM9_9PLEO|nr:hypothetical protein K491DRAFT_722153 [Lophiostoma macrostomum CBS 122681]
MAGNIAKAPQQEADNTSIKSDCEYPQSEQNSPPSSPRISKPEKRVRKPGFSITSIHLHPLPTIETLMTYPAISRPVYNRLVRGEPPADNYKTVIHTPKPYNMRTLDQTLIRAAETQAYRRRKRSNSGLRSRSSTTSSTASSYVDRSSNSSVAGDSDTSAYDSSDPSSSASVSSTTKATVASSPAVSPNRLLFPRLYSDPARPMLTNLLPRSPFIESDILNAYSDPPSQASSPLLAQSFHSTISAFSDTSSEGSAPQSTRSSAPSPASSAYPSPPASPLVSRRSSSSGEGFLYPSPPPSPHPAQLAFTLQPQSQFQSQSQNLFRSRERRAFSTPPPAAPTPPLPLRHRSASLTSHPPLYTFSNERVQVEINAEEFDLGEQTLGGGMLFDVEEEGEDTKGMGLGQDDMEWSMNGGEVVFGAAGVAMSPRALRGSCCPCEHECGGGLGLYVIDEEGEGEGDVEEEEEEEVMGGVVA